eukprot:912273-Pyramimonas_sp.AAC.1
MPCWRRRLKQHRWRDLVGSAADHGSWQATFEKWRSLMWYDADGLGGACGAHLTGAQHAGDVCAEG